MSNMSFTIISIMDLSSQDYHERISTLNWRELSIFSFMRYASWMMIRSIMLLSLIMKMMFISRMIDSNLIFICWKQFSTKREGEEGCLEREVVEESRIEIEVLGKEINERALNRLQRLYTILKIVDIYIFLLIDMIL